MPCDKVIQQLSAFLDGELTAEEEAAVRSHLDSCARCRRELEDLQQTVQAVSRLPRVPAPPDLHAKVLSGLDSAEAEVREERAPQQSQRLHAAGRVPLWRVFWGAAAAILIAAVIMLLNIPASRARRNSTTAAHAPQVAKAPAATQERRRGMAAPVMEAQRGEAENAARLSPSAPLLDESAKEGEGGPAPGDKVKAEAPAMKAAAPGMAFAAARAGAMIAVPVESAIEEIVLPSTNPEAAFARARALAEERGWLAPEPADRVLFERVKAEPQVPKMVLRLKRSQVPLLKDALAKAGLAATEGRFGAKPVADMKAASVLRVSTSGAPRKGEVLNELQQQSQGEALSVHAAAAPAAGPAPAAVEQAAGTTSAAPPMPLSSSLRLRAEGRAAPGTAGGSADAALQKAPDDAFVQVVLAFPRAEGAAPGKSEDGK